MTRQRLYCEMYNSPEFTTWRASVYFISDIMNSTLWRVTHIDPYRNEGKKNPWFEFYFRPLIKHDFIQESNWTDFYSWTYLKKHEASRRGIKRWRDGPFSLINYSNLIKSLFERENGQRWLYTNSDEFNGRTGWKLLAFLPLVSWPSNKEHENEKIIKCNIATLNIEPCPNFLIIDVI